MLYSFQFLRNYSRHTNIRFQETGIYNGEPWDFVTVEIGDPRSDIGRIGGEQIARFGKWFLVTTKKIIKIKLLILNYSFKCVHSFKKMSIVEY